MIFITFFTIVELSGFYWFLFGAITDATLLFKLSQLATSTVVNFFWVKIVVILYLLFGAKGSSPFEMWIYFMVWINYYEYKGVQIVTLFINLYDLLVYKLLDSRNKILTVKWRGYFTLY